MTILQKIIFSQILKILKKKSKMEFISVKLQTYSVQIPHYFRESFQILVFLKEHFSKSLLCSIVQIKCSPAVHIPHFYKNQN